MSLRTYLASCAAVAVVTALVMLFVPPVSDAFESILLLFLSTNAS